MSCMYLAVNSLFCNITPTHKHICMLSLIYNSKASLRELDKAAELAVIGHSIGAYVSTLDVPHLKHLATNVVRDVTSWLVKLFRYSPLLS